MGLLLEDAVVARNTRTGAVKVVHIGCMTGDEQRNGGPPVAPDARRVTFKCPRCGQPFELGGTDAAALAAGA